MLINLYSEQRHLVHQRIKRAERTKPFAKRAVKQYAQNMIAIKTASFHVNSEPKAERIPSLTAARGIAPSSTPCGQIYLQKTGHPFRHHLQSVPEAIRPQTTAPHILNMSMVSVFRLTAFARDFMQ